MDHPGPVESEKNVEDTRDYCVTKKLLGKQLTWERTQYLLQWLRYRPEHSVCL